MNTTADVLKFLIAAYPNQEITAETVKAYALALTDIEPQLLQAATLHHISISKWFPTIAELRTATVQLAIPHDDAAAWDAWAGVKQFRVTGPIAQLAINALGGMDTFRQSPIEDEMSWRARFIEAYRQYQRRIINGAMMLPQVKQVRNQLRGGKHAGALAELSQRMQLSRPVPGTREHEDWFNQQRDAMLLQAGEGTEAA